MRTLIFPIALSLAATGCFIIRDFDESESQRDRLCYDINDNDCDGLKDDVEDYLGTDPRNQDSDYDGVDDGDEVEAGTDPMDADTDKDGLDDGP